MSERIPAECWPVGQFLAEEMKARGWTCADVTARMGLKTDYERRVWELTVDLWLYCSDEPGVAMNQENAEHLGVAFGISPQFFINLHDSYWRWRKAHGVMAEPERPM